MEDILVHAETTLGPHRHSHSCPLWSGLVGAATHQPSCSRRNDPFSRLDRHGHQCVVVSADPAQLDAHPLGNASPMETTWTEGCSAWAEQLPLSSERPGMGRFTVTDHLLDQLGRSMGAMAGRFQCCQADQRPTSLLWRWADRRAAIQRLALGRAQSAHWYEASGSRTSGDFQPGAHPIQFGILADAEPINWFIPTWDGPCDASATRRWLTVGMHRAAWRIGWRVVCASVRLNSVVSSISVLANRPWRQSPWRHGGNCLLRSVT